MGFWVTRGARGIFYDTRDLLKLIRGTYSNEVKTTELDVLKPVMDADVTAAGGPVRMPSAEGRGDPV